MTTYRVTATFSEKELLNYINVNGSTDVKIEAVREESSDAGSRASRQQKDSHPPQARLQGHRYDPRPARQGRGCSGRSEVVARTGWAVAWLAVDGARAPAEGRESPPRHDGSYTLAEAA